MQLQKVQTVLNKVNKIECGLSVNAREETEYQYNHRHWKAEINNFRNQIRKIIKRSPSLKNYLIEIYFETYQDALESKRFEFDIPDHQPISLENVLDKQYF